MEKLQSLEKMWSMSDMEKDQKDLQFDLESAELSLNSDILATRKSLQAAEGTVQAALQERPFSASKIVQAINEVEELENGLKALESLKTTLFPKKELQHFQRFS